MAEGNRFGPLITGLDVERAARDTMLLWTPDYLAEVAERAGYDRGFLPDYRSYVLSADMDRFSEEQLPTCVVMVPGTAEIYRSRTAYNVTWDLRIGAFVSGRDQESSLALAKLYVAAAVAALVQHPSLGGIATQTVWTEANYDIVDFDDTRTLAAGVALFHTVTENVLDSLQGPSEPSEDATVDPGAWPTVDPMKISVSYRVEE